jgi:hypothetical protein
MNICVFDALVCLINFDFNLNLEETNFCAFSTCCKKQRRVPEDSVDSRRKESEPKMTSLHKSVH